MVYHVSSLPSDLRMFGADRLPVDDQHLVFGRGRTPLITRYKHLWAWKLFLGFGVSPPQKKQCLSLNPQGSLSPTFFHRKETWFGVTSHGWSHPKADQDWGLQNWRPWRPFIVFQSLPWQISFFSKKISAEVKVVRRVEIYYLTHSYDQYRWYKRAWCAHYTPIDVVSSSKYRAFAVSFPFFIFKWSSSLGFQKAIYFWALKTDWKGFYRSSYGFNKSTKHRQKHPKTSENLWFLEGLRPWISSSLRIA